jgi:hypothetical protein
MDKQAVGAICFKGQMGLIVVALAFVPVPWLVANTFQPPHFLLDASLVVLFATSVGQLIPMIVMQFCSPSVRKRVLSLFAGALMPLIAVADFAAIAMGASAL